MSKYFLSKEYINTAAHVYLGTVVICALSLLIVIFLGMIYFNSISFWVPSISLLLVFSYGIILNIRKYIKWGAFAKNDFVSVDLKLTCLVIRHFGNEKKYPTQTIREIGTHKHKNELDYISILLGSGERIKLRGYKKLTKLLFDIRELKVKEPKNQW